MLCPITALSFFQATNGQVLILVGEDTWLKVYDTDTSELLGQLNVFTAQPIHGIHIVSPKEDASGPGARILIWGAGVVTVLPLTVLDALAHGADPHVQLNPCNAHDWIYDGQLSPYDTRHGVLVTAHNEIVPVTVDPEDSSLAFGALASPSKPILYSACLSWLSEDSVLVVGGTAFGEIVVWKAHSVLRDNHSCELLFVFTGHEGSIFGVTLSPELELAPGTRTRLLASCSDDRTIRVWDVTDEADEKPRPNGSQLKELGAARETGFGGSLLESSSEEGGDPSRCVAVGMAHASRIWHVRFSGRKNHHLPARVPVELFSFGEDSTRIAWQLELNPEWRRVSKTATSAARAEAQFATLKRCGMVSCHTGKNIWSVATLDTQGEDPLTATGGADGKVALMGENQPAPRTSDLNPKHTGHEPLKMEQILALSFDEIVRPLKEVAGSEWDQAFNPLKKNEKDAFQNYSFLSDDTLLLTLRSGRLVLGSVTEISWTEVLAPDSIRADLARYNVIKSPLQGAALLGSGSGNVYLYTARQGIRLLATVQGKIAGIIALPGYDHGQEVDDSSAVASVLVTALGQKEATIITIDVAREDCVLNLCKIEPEEPRVITAAGICSGRLVLGSRIGAVTVYKKTADGFVLEQSRRDTSNREAVTSITPLPRSSGSFVATFRDGTYRIYTIQGLLHGQGTLGLQHEASPPLTVIEEAWFTRSKGGEVSLMLSGFKGNNFILWDETSRHEVATIECGGGHRPFSCVPDLTRPDRFRFVYTKAAHMHLHSQSHASLRRVKTGGHGREIKSAASCDKYLATAAEDTTIRIWHYNSSEDALQRSLQCLAILEKHTAGIQCLKWRQAGGAYWLLSSSGNEEFFIWRISQFDSDYRGLAIVCVAHYPHPTADRDLRITDFDVVQDRDFPVREGDPDACAMHISLTLSNSTLRKYRYVYEGSGNGSFSLIAEGRYTGACLTHTRQLRVNDNNASYILTGATDGHVAVWEHVLDSASGEQKDGCGILSPVLITRIHQNSIKTLDLQDHTDAEGSRGWLVVTGGDDNALGILHLRREAGKAGFTAASKSRIKDAHAAALTGVCLMPGDDGHATVASGSIHQSIKVWRVETARKGAAKVRLLHEAYSSIADSGGLEMVSPQQFLAFGVGMEIWRLAG